MSGIKQTIFDPEEKTGLPPIFIGEQVLDMPEPDWLMEDFIQEGGLTVVYGDPGDGKSLVMQDWANVLAAPGKGWQWLGRARARRCNVLYIMGEGQGGLRGRLLAWRAHRNLETLPPVQWAMEGISLHRPAEMKENEFTKRQKALLDYCYQEQIDVLFVDTLAATFGGGNENLQVDMNQYLHTLEQFKENSMAVVVAHHQSKAGEMRGSTVLMGSADTVIKIQADRDKESNRILMATLKNMKQKDGTPFLPVHLRPKSYEVDTKTGSHIVFEYMAKEERHAAKGSPYGDSVLDFIQENPGKPWRVIREKVSGKSQNLAEARDDLLDRSLIFESDGRYYAGNDPDEI